MKLFYYKDPAGNFGDDLNGWLWEKLLPGCWGDDGITLCGIGTIIGNFMPPSRQWVVFGSGTGYSVAPPDFGDSKWNVVAVRGPLTAQVLALPPECAVTDGAIMLSLLPEFQPVPVEQRHGIVFMPHHKALRFGRWREACEQAGIEFLDPRDDCRKTAERIRHAKLVLADAMHAAIVADTARVPWVALKISTETNSFKWLDWAMSMQLAYAPRQLPFTSLFEKAQSLIAAGLGTGHALVDMSVPAAVSHYHGALRRREDFWAPNLRRATNLSLSMMRALMRLPVIGHMTRSADQKQFELAVAALKSAAQQHNASLSDDAVFAGRKQEMQRRLEIVGNLARPSTDAQPDRPRIAVLIPAYNAELEIGAALASLARNSEPHDIIVVDDGSKRPLIDAVPPQSNLVILRTPQNLGITGALNYGLKYILDRGYEFVARLDADDEAAPDRLQKQREFLDTYADIGLVGGWAKVISETGQELFRLNHPAGHKAIGRALNYNSCFLHPSLMMRASVLRQVGGYSADYPSAEDYELIRRIGKVTQLANLPEYLINYRLSTGGISQTKRKEQLSSRLRIQLAYKNYFDPHFYAGVVKTLLLWFMPTNLILNLKRKRAALRHPA